ncbi:MAG: PsbP-related protein [Candidatus Magasanikbacteria bacterium]
MNKKSVITIVVVIIVVLVGVTTYFVTTKTTDQKQQQIANQNSPSNNTTITIPTGWKIYQNKDFKFEFAYPQNWNVGDLTATTNNLLTLGMGVPGLGDDTAWVNVVSEEDLAKAIDLHVKNYVEGTKIEKEQKFTLDGIEGKLIYLNIGGNSPDLDRWVFVKYDSKVYNIGITYDVAPYDEEFSQVLSTFKFVK